MISTPTSPTTATTTSTASSTTTRMGRMRSRGRVIPVLLATTVLVGGFSLSADAGGGKKPVLAGKTTKASKTTTIKTTGNGPALKLKTKASKPPLAVTSRQKVSKLNADQVDGLDAADLATQTLVYRLPEQGVSSTRTTHAFPGLPPGTYLVNYTATLEGDAEMNEGLCYLFQDSGPAFYVGLSYNATRASSFATVSASTPLDMAGGAPMFRCNSTVPFVFEQGEVMFTRTSFVEAGALVPATRAGRSSEVDRGASTE